MKNISLIFLAALFMAACTLSDSIEFSGDLAVREVTEGALEVETPDTFRFEFGADTYIYGVCDQLSVDVVVTLYDTAGNSMQTFDGPGVGPEMFQYDIEDPGRYLLEIKPFEKESGDYTLELQVVEPMAKDPAKRADQILRLYSGDDTPGAVVGVMHHGELIFSKAESGCFPEDEEILSRLS